LLETPKISLGRIIVLCLAMVLALGTPAVHGEPGASEYAVKAAIIFKIAKFVSWPNEDNANSDTPISICLREEDPIGPAIDALSGEIVHGRKIQVRRLNNVRTLAKDCEILYLSRPTAEQQASLLTRVSDAPVLTIGDTRSFTQAGGIISLDIAESRVQFAINVAASQRAGLEISAQLLQLSTLDD
jgi:hypothetical protein